MTVSVTDVQQETVGRLGEEGGVQLEGEVAVCPVVLHHTCLPRPLPRPLARPVEDLLAALPGLHLVEGEHEGGGGGHRAAGGHQAGDCHGPLTWRLTGGKHMRGETSRVSEAVKRRGGWQQVCNTPVRRKSFLYQPALTCQHHQQEGQSEFQHRFVLKLILNIFTNPKQRARNLDIFV